MAVLPNLLYPLREPILPCYGENPVNSFAYISYFGSTCNLSNDSSTDAEVASQLSNA